MRLLVYLSVCLSICLDVCLLRTLWYTCRNVKFGLKQGCDVAPVQVVGLETPCTTSVSPINLALLWGKAARDVAALNLDIKGEYSRSNMKKLESLKPWGQRDLFTGVGYPTYCMETYGT